jgi:hypothetical protein
MGTEGLHQARMSPLVRAVEALHAKLLNHATLKGLSEDGKRIRFGEFLMSVAKHGLVFGTDKSKNDACFSEEVWTCVVRYLAAMADIFAASSHARGYVYTKAEECGDTTFPSGVLRMKYWVMLLTPMLAILLSGIAPTSLVNRIESIVENGVAVLVLYGEEAYAKWRRAETQPVESKHPEWGNLDKPHADEHISWTPLLPRMVTDTSVACDKLEPNQIITHHMSICEGDDQIHAFLPVGSDYFEGLTTKEKVLMYTKVLSENTRFIFEAALPATEMEMTGSNGIMEMLSCWIGLPVTKTHDRHTKAVIVPKVLKALRKLPHCSLSSSLTLIRNDANEVVSVEQNSTFWALALTKYYSLTIINKESLGVRGLFMAHGDYCYEQLELLVGKAQALNHRTQYGDRDPEKRGIEEYKATSFEYCGNLRLAAHDAVEGVDQDYPKRVCAAAWCADLPGLEKVNRDEVMSSLIAFDNSTMGLTITREHVDYPMMLWRDMELGVLRAPLLRYATMNARRVAELFKSEAYNATSEKTVELARKAGARDPAGTMKGTHTDKASKGKGKGDGKRTGGGATDAQAPPSSANNPASKGKGKGKPSGHPSGKGHAAAQPTGTRRHAGRQPARSARRAAEYYREDRWS